MMRWDEQKAYAEIVTNGFSTNEIEALEVVSDHYFPMLDGDIDEIHIQGPLQLEMLWRYEGEGQ